MSTILLLLFSFLFAPNIFAQRPCEECTPVDTVITAFPTILCEGSLSGDLGNGGKWVGQFNGLASADYHFDLCSNLPCNGNSSGFDWLDPDIFILDAGCNIIAYEDGSPDCNYAPNDYVWQCAISGTYYVVIEPYDPFSPSLSCFGTADHVFTLAYYATSPTSEQPARCCYALGDSCADLTRSECDSVGGLWDESLVCSDCACNLIEPNDSLWMQVFGTDGDEMTESWSVEFGRGDVVPTSDGGALAVTNSWTGDYNDIFVVKTDSLGRREWERSYGGSGNQAAASVCIASDGGFVIAGRNDYWPSNSCDFHLMKLNGAGDQLWTRNIDLGSCETANGIIATPDAGFAIVGEQWNGALGRNSVVVVKVDADGDVIWNRLYPLGLNSWGRDVIQTPDGGYMVTGFGDFGNNVHVQLLLLRLDINGDSLWTKIHGREDTRGFSIDMTTDSGFVVTGHSYWKNFYAFKFDANGDSVWSRSYGGNSHSVAATQDGGVVIVGHASDAGSENVKIVKTDANGVVEWTRLLGGTGADAGRAVKQMLNGSYIVAGYSESYCNRGRDLLLVRLGSPATPPVGRCCYDNGQTCADVSESECYGLFGAWWPGLSCGSSPCMVGPDSCTTVAYGGSTGGTDRLYSLAPMSDCGMLICGWNYSSAGNDQGWLIKMDANSATVFDRKFGSGADDRLYQCRDNDDGTALVVGRTGSLGAGGQDGWLLKINGVGDTVWTRTYGSLLDDRLYTFHPVTTGGYVMGGATQPNVSGLQDFWLVRVDANGNQLWQRRYGGAATDLCWEVVETSDGGFVLSGYTNSFGSGSADWLVIKTNSSGDSMWSRVFGGTGFDECLGTLPIEGGDVIVSGYEFDGQLNSTVCKIRRLDSLGSTVWESQANVGGSQIASNMRLASGGTLLVSGFSDESGISQMALYRFSQDGDLLTYSTFGNSVNHSVWDAAETESGDIWMCGYNSMWNGSDWHYQGEVVKLGGCDLRAPIAPEVVVSTEGDDVLLHWEPILSDSGSCAVVTDHFEVYVASNVDGPYDHLASTSDTAYIHSNGLSTESIQFYTVRAIAATVPARTNALEIGDEATPVQTVPLRPLHAQVE